VNEQAPKKESTKESGKEAGVYFSSNVFTQKEGAKYNFKRRLTNDINRIPRVIVHINYL
jgi:hypothetical protein